MQVETFQPGQAVIHWSDTLNGSSLTSLNSSDKYILLIENIGGQGQPGGPNQQQTTALTVNLTIYDAEAPGKAFLRLLLTLMKFGLTFKCLRQAVPITMHLEHMYHACPILW